MPQRPDPLLDSADPADPQTWNRYAYTRNNPLRFVDPDGRQARDAIGQRKHELKKAVAESGLEPAGKAILILAIEVTVPGSKGEALLASLGPFGKISSLSKVGKAARTSRAAKAEILAANKSMGAKFEEFLGLTEPRKQIVSLTRTSTRRFPDAVTRNAIIEAKFVSAGRTLGLSNQLRDFALFAEQKGLKFILKVPKGTKLTKELKEAIDSGRITLEEVAFHN